MVATLIGTDGSVTTFKGGIAHVTGKLTDMPNPEAAAQQVLGPDPLVGKYQ